MILTPLKQAKKAKSLYRPSRPTWFTPSEKQGLTGRHKYANSRMVRLLNAPASHPQTSFFKDRRMGFFSSIKRLWSSNKTAETPETPQVPAEEALADPQPAETEDGASHEESSVSDADNLLNRTGKLPHLRLPPNLPLSPTPRRNLPDGAIRCCLPSGKPNRACPYGCPSLWKISDPTHARATNSGSVSASF